MDYQSKKLRSGFVREDGMVFLTYMNRKKVNGTEYKYDYWVTRKEYETRKIAEKERARARRKRPEILARIKEYRQKYNSRKDVKKKRNAHLKERRIVDPCFVIAKRMRDRIRSAVYSKNTKKCERTKKLIGCSFKFLKYHLESQFKEGMSWDNPSSFHIDHIRPLASFDLTDPKQQELACNWKNLQPLYPEENIRKGMKF